MSATYQDLVKEVLDELLLERPGSEQAVKIRSEQLGYEVTAQVSECFSTSCVCNLHILQRGDEDVTQTDDLFPCQHPSATHLLRVVPTFSCLKCLSSFSSR